MVEAFAGIAAVSEGMANSRAVILNDSLAFIACLARARFLPRPITDSATMLQRVQGALSVVPSDAFDPFDAQVRREARVLESGDWLSLRHWMETVPHVGNSKSRRRLRDQDLQGRLVGTYRLASLYFSGGYLSVKQARDLDMIRSAAELVDVSPEERDWLLASWLVAVASLLNAPGHSAQYLTVHDQRSADRVSGNFRRDAWRAFSTAIGRVVPIGSTQWRDLNQVTTNDACDLFELDLTGVGVIYADPPYTKDQYSRYYHVLETLYVESYPQCNGKGRYPALNERTSSLFSVRSKVSAAFDALASACATRNLALVVSYPSIGLVPGGPEGLFDMLGTHFNRVMRTELANRHSTMGASRGHADTRATEYLYVCK